VIHRIRPAATGAFLVLIGLLVAGCAPRLPYDPAQAGRTVVYEAGLPDFDLESMGTVRAGKPGLEVYIGLPYVSLVFSKADSGFTARFSRGIIVRDAAGAVQARRAVGPDTLRAETYEATHAYAPVLFTHRLALPEGAYMVEAWVMDEQSGKQAVRRQEAVVPGVTAAQRAASGILLQRGLAEGGGEPLVSLHIPADETSLRAVLELYGGARGAPVEVSMRLLQFASDTTIAAPPFLFKSTRGSAPYGGVSYRKADTLQVTHRVVHGDPDGLAVVFELPALGAGIYRIQVEGRSEDGGLLFIKERELSVKPQGFPRIVDLDELVAALAYIAEAQEIEHIRAGATALERKRRFDAFWAARTGNKVQAADLIARYYSRVEEANLRYTSFKAGWKTDRGMVSIVLGSPLYNENRLDHETWFYSYDGERGGGSFVFERVFVFDALIPYPHYVLERRPAFDYEWRRAVERWRRGEVR